MAAPLILPDLSFTVFRALVAKLDPTGCRLNTDQYQHQSAYRTNYRIINFIYVVYSVFSDLHEYNTPMCQFFFAIFEFLHLKAVFYNDDTFCLEHIIEVLLTFAWNRLKKNFNTIIPVSYGLEPDIAIVLAKKCISSSVKNNIISPWNKPRYVTKSLLLIF